MLTNQEDIFCNNQLYVVLKQYVYVFVFAVHLSTFKFNESEIKIDLELHSLLVIWKIDKHITAGWF